MDFSHVNTIVIPEGNVTKIQKDTVTLWESDPDKIYIIENGVLIKNDFVYSQLIRGTSGTWTPYNTINFGTDFNESYDNVTVTGTWTQQTDYLQLDINVTGSSKVTGYYAKQTEYTDRKLHIKSDLNLTGYFGSLTTSTGNGMSVANPWYQYNGQNISSLNKTLTYDGYEDTQNIFVAEVDSDVSRSISGTFKFYDLYLEKIS